MPLTPAALPPLAGAGGDPEWEIVVIDRANTNTFADIESTSSAASWPLVAFNGQDPLSDVGVGVITFPLNFPFFGDPLEEDMLLLFYVRGTPVVQMKLGPADLTLVGRNGEQDEVQEWRLETLFGILNEGLVDPPGGASSLPASADRIFDWSDPARDNSDFTVPYVLGSVSDAQTNYAVTPYAIGASGTDMEFPGSVSVIGPAGFGWTADAPSGRIYGYIDHTFAGGYYRVNGTGDNGIEVRVDGKVIQPFTIGFGTAFHVPKFPITTGSHRVAFVIENGGADPLHEGPCTAAIEFVLADAGDNGTLELATSSSWRIMEFPANPPGFTVGEILNTVITENQAHGQLLDITATFTDSNDTAGTPWADTWDVSTKSTGSLGSFFLKELSETYCDFRMRFDDTDGLLIDAWVKDGRGTLTAVTLTRGVNIGQLRVDGSPTLATAFTVTDNIGGDLGYQEVSVTPVAGHPRKQQGLSLGAAHTAEEVTRVATQQLDLFGRKRGMTTVTHLTNQSTVDSEMPGLAYWTGDRITIPTDIALTPASVRVIAMTWQLDRTTGQFVFTPQLGDLVIPPEARAGQTLKKLAAPGLGGNARPATP